MMNHRRITCHDPACKAACPCVDCRTQAGRDRKFEKRIRLAEHFGFDVEQEEQHNSVIVTLGWNNNPPPTGPTERQRQQISSTTESAVCTLDLRELQWLERFLNNRAVYEVDNAAADEVNAFHDKHPLLALGNANGVLAGQVTSFTALQTQLASLQTSQRDDRPAKIDAVIQVK
jgi:hypothetical protein